MALTLQDYEDIRQLFARLQYNIDFGNGEGYAAGFAEDGYFEVTGLPEEAEHAGRHQGRDAIVAFANQLFSGNRGHSRHWHGNFVYTEESENHARVLSYFMVVRPGETPTAGVTLTGLYDDVLVKQDGRWFVKSRSASADPQLQHSEAPTDVLVVRRDEYVAGRS
ncbi:nuclear transport factor 2 family protein [Microbacterium trichothecenolyticum]|uniref:nuclear transport factor 2 family protein n=1 Tax=Microbacterium trichothecenolyticum TaxID=69370 RepID=UPI001C6E1DD5|nr:nuclear transport factor 2 family protein [Microbacterium trichothecenolyticum]MBW9122070.1 nuclear transport factor 2 family protein [Microbacterium trichothecenolyticum]